VAYFPDVHFDGAQIQDDFAEQAFLDDHHDIGLG
jgi:hypothetical protein